MAIGERGRVFTGTGGGGWAQQIPALLGEVCSAAEPVHEAMIVGRLADEDDAFKLVVPEDQLLVNAERWIFQADAFDTLPLIIEVTGAKDIGAHDLELSGGGVTGENGAAVAGDRSGEDFALLPKGCDKAEELAVEFRAFADGIN